MKPIIRKSSEESSSENWMLPNNPSAAKFFFKWSQIFGFKKDDSLDVLSLDRVSIDLTGIGIK
jgi:hypothetical protein